MAATTPSTSPKIAVIGAGLAGLACARTLVDAGYHVTIFDKGRSAGGRINTRRDTSGTFDLGAQYFTAQDSYFAQHVARWQDAGICAPWRGRIVAFSQLAAEPQQVRPLRRFVATPTMSALPRYLAANLDLRVGHRVDQLVAKGEQTQLLGTTSQDRTLAPAGRTPSEEQDFGTFDLALCCLPAPQAAQLLVHIAPNLAQLAASVVMQPCLALALTTAESCLQEMSALPYDAAFIGEEGKDETLALSWIARDSSKPGREAGDRWVLHAAGNWSQRNFSLDDSAISQAMISAFTEAIGVASFQPSFSYLRRWAHSRASQPLELRAHFDSQSRLGLAGDWMNGGKVQGAFLSGVELAQLSLHALASPSAIEPIA